MNTSIPVPVTAHTRVTRYQSKDDPHPEIQDYVGSLTSTMVYRQTSKKIHSFTLQPFTRENVRGKGKKGAELFGEMSRRYKMSETFN